MEVYRILNLVTGKSYIGKTNIGIINRYKKHISNAKNNINRYLYDSMNKHGYNYFIIGTLEECSSIEELNTKEIYYIKKYNSLYPNGYNMTLGGDGGSTLSSWSEENKQKLYKQQSLTRTGLKRTVSQKQNMSLAQKGKIISEETRLKISNTLKVNYLNKSEEDKRKTTEHLKLTYGNRKNQTHSETTKKLMSLKASRTWEEKYSEEEILLRKQNLKERLKKNNPNKVDITNDQILSIKTFITTNIKVTTLSEQIGLSPFKIRQVLRSLGIENLQLYRKHKEKEFTHEKTSNNTESVCNLPN